MILLEIQFDQFGGLYLFAAIVIILVIFLYSMMRRYKRCPSDRILVFTVKQEADNLQNVFMVVLCFYLADYSRL